MKLLYQRDEQVNIFLDPHLENVCKISPVLWKQ